MRSTMKSSCLPGIFLLVAGVLAFPFSPTLLGQSLHAIPAATLSPSFAASPTPTFTPSPTTAASDESDDMVAEDLLALDGPELPQRGFNASAAFSGLHDTQLGWAGFVQPAISYRFNHVLSADVTIPIYFYRMAYKYKNGQPLNGPLTAHSGELGDTTIAGHVAFSIRRIDDTMTLAINAPTGDATYGLSTGRVTYVAMNDLESTIRHYTPDLQLGIGDSSDLVNRKVIRNYDTLGTLAYFQGGALDAISSHLNLEGDVYEQLPLGNQKVYTQVTRKGKKVKVKESNGSAEDNGFTATLIIPTQKHLEISAYGNRSVRLADTTVGLTLTFSLKAPKTDSFTK